MVGIVRSKKQLITAVRSSGSTPATFTPIQFTRPVSYAAYGTSPFYHTGYVFSIVITACLLSLQAQKIFSSLQVLNVACRRTRSCSTCVAKCIFLISCSRRHQCCTCCWGICQPIISKCKSLKAKEAQGKSLKDQE